LPDSFTVIKNHYLGKVESHIIQLIIAEKKLRITKEHSCDLKFLTDKGIQDWLSRCGPISQGLTWEQVNIIGTSCHSVSPDDLYTILSDIFGEGYEDVNLYACKRSGAFTEDELMRIFPSYVFQLKEEERKAEKLREMMIEEIKQKKTEHEESLKWKLKEREALHKLDEEFKGHKEKPKTKKPTYDESSRLGNVGIILDENFRNTNYPYKFDFDNQGVRHTAIIGGSGSGKSGTAFDIAEEALLKGIPVLALDPEQGQWAGLLKPCDDKSMISKYQEFGMSQPRGFTGKVYTPSSNVGIPLKTNLLARPPTDKEGELIAKANDVSKIIDKICDIKNDARKVNVRTRIFDYWKTDESKKRHLDIKSLQKLFTGKKDDILKDKLELLKTCDYLFEGDPISDFESEFLNSGQISAIVLTGIDEEEVKMHVSYYILRELVSYFDSQHDTDKMRLLLVAEEAHGFIGEAQDMLNLIARTLRKKGVGCLFVSQVMHDLPLDIQANTATKIYMKTEYDRDIEKSRKEIGQRAEHLRNLPLGVGVVAYSGQPFLVRFRPFYHKPNV